MRSNPKIVSLDPLLAAAAGLVPNAPPRDDLMVAVADTPALLTYLGFTHPEELDEAELGRGGYARAFLSPSGKVLKLTVDPSDAMISSALAAEGPVPGLVNVELVQRVPGKVKETASRTSPEVDLYAIVAERVFPLHKMYPPEDGMPSFVSREMSEGLKDALDSVAFATSRMTGMSRHRELDSKDHTLMRAIAEGDRRGISAEGMQYIYDLIEGWYWMADRGFRMGDLHAGNAGLTADGHAVLLDLGLTADEQSSREQAERLPLASNAGADVEVRDRWSNRGAIDLAAYVGDEVVGNITAAPGTFEGESVWLVASIYVDPEHRRRGVGQALWEAAAAEAERRGSRLGSTYRTSHWADAFWAKQVREGNVDVFPRAGMTGQDVYLLRRGAVLANVGHQTHLAHQRARQLVPNMSLSPRDRDELMRRVRELDALEERAIEAYERGHYALAEQIDAEYAEKAEQLEGVASELMEGWSGEDLEPGEWDLGPGGVTYGPEGSADLEGSLASLYQEYLDDHNHPASRFHPSPYSFSGSPFPVQTPEDVLAYLALRTIEDSTSSKVERPDRKLLIEAARDAYERRRELRDRYGAGSRSVASNPSGPSDVRVDVRLPRTAGRPGVVRLTAQDEDGSFTVAHANLRVSGDHIEVQEAKVADGYRGMGYGRKLYEEVFRAAAKRGLAVQSDRRRSDDSEAFWRRLADDGIAEGRGSGGTRLVAKEGRDFSFRVAGQWPHLYWRVDDPAVVGRLTRNKGHSKVDRVFDETFDVIENMFPDFGSVELYEDEAAGSDNGAGADRQYAYCMDGNPIQIAFAPKAEDLPLNRLRGLMRHEFGHALEFRYGVAELESRLSRRLPEYSERRADIIAECVFGEPIQYDSRNVQCVRVPGAKKRRPRYLPDKREKLRANTRRR